MKNSKETTQQKLDDFLFEINQTQFVKLKSLYFKMSWRMRELNR